MQTSSTDRKRLTAAPRKRMLAAYRRSKLPQREFAAQAGIGLSPLQLWLRKSVAPTADAGGFVAVPHLLAPSTASAVYRLHLKNGVMVELGSGFAGEEVAVLLQLLATG